MDDFHAPQLFIDKDGLWYADGVLMIRKEIIKLFAAHLKKDSNNKYYIDWQNQSYPVTVEDVPFWVRSVDGQDGRLMLRLFDGRTFPLPPGSIFIKNNIPYVSLFWPCDTRLSRHAYWELCEYASEQDGRYRIKYGDTEWLLEEAE